MDSSLTFLEDSKKIFPLFQQVIRRLRLEPEAGVLKVRGCAVLRLRTFCSEVSCGYQKGFDGLMPNAPTFKA